MKDLSGEGLIEVRFVDFRMRRMIKPIVLSDIKLFPLSDKSDVAHAAFGNQKIISLDPN